MKGKAGRFSRRAPFSPASVAGLTGWWDASDSSTLFDDPVAGALTVADGVVARFEDKSGNGRHFAQSTAGKEPLRKTNVINGLDCLRFDGSNDFMSNLEQTADLIDADASAVFLVAKAESATSNDASIFNNQMILSDLGGSHGYFALKSNDTAAAYGYDSDVRTASLAYVPGNWTFMSAWHDGSDLYASLDGGTPVSVALSTRTFLNFTALLGCNFTTATVFHGDIAELITYNQALSASDRGSVESYLADKYGIS